MIDMNLLREHPDIVKKDLKKRQMPELAHVVDTILALDKEWRELKQEAEALRHKRNEVSRDIAVAKKAGKNADKMLKEASQIPEKIAKIEQQQDAIRQEMDAHLMKLPNILHASVPEGKSEADNVVVKLFGKKPAFSFTPKGHVELLEQNGWVDLDRAAKIAGARFWFLKGELVLLDMALQHYALDFISRKGFVPLRPPFMMNRMSYAGVVDLADFENVMYKIEDEDLYMIATSEHPLTAQFMDEILEEKQLPIKLCGISSCFRKEAGTHGKDTKGIFRGHQFDKIEQIILCRQEDSWNLHEELIGNAIAFFDSLGLHFRQILMCAADNGMVAAKKYDLETWMPVQQQYREVVSCSNCTEYQSRRLKIRYRTAEGNKPVHTLNSTLVATSRALVAILENFQDADGSVNIPKVLQPYMGGVKKIGGKK